MNLKSEFKLIRWCVLGIAAILPYGLMSQVESEYQASFDEFNKQIHQEFNEFKQNNDTVFNRFLKESWKEFNLMTDDRGARPKPPKQPIIDIRKDTGVRSLGGPKTIQWMDTNHRLMKVQSPLKYRVLQSYQEVKTVKKQFMFYGLPIDLTVPVKPVSPVDNINNEEISDQFLKFAENEVLPKTLEELLTYTEQINLNGWGAFELYSMAASLFFTKTNDQLLFTWYTMLESGYDIRVGYNGDRVYLMAAMDTHVYFRPYFTLEGTKYYLINFKDEEAIDHLTSYEIDYSDLSIPISLAMTSLPKLPTQPTDRVVIYKRDSVEFVYNQHLTTFYQAYPQCDLQIYFQAPLSLTAEKNLKANLIPMLKGLPEIEKVNTLLRFVQNMIDYKTDTDQFGKENYLFAEETMAYPYADCEDRAVFLFSLMRLFTDLKAIGVVYEDHVLLAVHLNQELPGTYIEYNNRKYYMADPTYIGATIGMIAPEYEHRQPEIIVLN